MKLCTACGAEYGDEVLFCQRDGTPLRKAGGAGDLVGQVLADRYHIQRKLGEGGMGQVYLAEHVKMGRRCAIKIMTPAAMSDPDAISRFNREAANASRISHANVCAIYDFGETPEGLIYLAMEFIEGQSLTGLIDAVGILPLARAAAIVAQCAEALQAAHELGIVHRDLKPDNIMVVTARGKDVVKVVDFGIAKAIGGEGQGQQVTRTGFVVGTPEYMSPEQLAGDPVDGRSDLYSLGLVFYRMLTGASPFPADSQQETMIKRLTDDPLTLAAARPGQHFPAEVQRVVDRALARSPSARYPAAADFARDAKVLATSMTGPVDVEAGTQVLPAGDPRNQVPHTRVDPSAARAPAKTAVAPPPTAAMPAPVAPKRAPVGAIAAVLVTVAALGGGGYAYRQGLLGGAPGADTTLTRDTSGSGSPIPDTGQPAPGSPQTPGTAAVTPLSRPEGAGQLPGATTTQPPAAARDSAARPGNLQVAPGGKITAQLPDLDSIFEKPSRSRARDSALAIYNNSAVRDSIRAEAASLVGQAYTEDLNFREARRWFELALQRHPRELYTKLLKDAEANLARAGGS